VKIMFAGDWHAGIGFGTAAIASAAARGAEKIAHVGDFGFWPRHPDGQKYIDAISAACLEHDVTVWFCDGNHEDHDSLPHDTAWEPVEVARGIHWVPRGVTLEWASTRLLFMGGAVSVDQFSRFPGKTWFPNETPSPGHWQRAMAAADIDVVVAHDTVPGMPVSGRPALSIPWSIRKRASDHRKRLAALQKSLQPRLWVHGHWHQRATATLNSTRFESLGHDRGSDADAALFCDLPSLELTAP
jgi:hypothetical protein